MHVSAVIRKLLKASPVARLATLDAQGQPHIVPVCFVYDGKVFYTAIDRKPKRVSPDRLTRVRNIRAVSQVALLVDEYHEDWSRLWYILIRGTAALIPESALRERAGAMRKLKMKYPQYSRGMLADDALIIRITPRRIASWGRI